MKSFGEWKIYDWNKLILFAYEKLARVLTKRNKIKIWTKGIVRPTFLNGMEWNCIQTIQNKVFGVGTTIIYKIVNSKSNFHCQNLIWPIDPVSVSKSKNREWEKTEKNGTERNLNITTMVPELIFKLKYFIRIQISKKKKLKKRNEWSKNLIIYIFTYTSISYWIIFSFVFEWAEPWQSISWSKRMRLSWKTYSSYSSM